jgi:hypothetical protein
MGEGIGFLQCRLMPVQVKHLRLGSFAVKDAPYSEIDQYGYGNSAYPGVRGVIFHDFNHTAKASSAGGTSHALPGIVLPHSPGPVSDSVETDSRGEVSFS